MDCMRLQKNSFYPYELITYRLHLNKINKLNSNSLKFKYIYDKNIWSSEESVSGIGSTLEYTKNLKITFLIYSKNTK